MKSIFEGLNSAQEAAVRGIEGPSLIIAGAGSGKTRVLTCKIANIIENGAAPREILALTFTNKAADEMRSRLEDVPCIGDAFIGTIHAFANRILKSSGKKYDLLTAEKEIEIVRYLINKYASYVTQDDYMQFLDLRHLIKLGAREESALREELSPFVLYELDLFYGSSPKSIDRNCYPENL